MSSLSAFIELAKAGLWGSKVFLSNYQPLNYDHLFQMASEQSLLGLIAAGLEQATDAKVPMKDILPFLGQVIYIEQHNKKLNNYVAWLFPRLSEEGITPVLVKGQGIAQTYIRPLWRASGDIDILIAEEDYEKAKNLLIPLAQFVDNEVSFRKHLALTISGAEVELHGTLRACLSKRIDKVLDRIQKEAFDHNRFRYWQNENTAIALPAADDDVIFVFVHILQHFFKGGIGLRQICDWCRLLWTYRDAIDRDKLQTRITEMGLTTEWRAFAALAVEVLGMHEDSMPSYQYSRSYTRKSKRILSYIVDAGNFGHNRDKSYITKKLF